MRSCFSNLIKTIIKRNIISNAPKYDDFGRQNLKTHIISSAVVDISIIIIYDTLSPIDS